MVSKFPSVGEVDREEFMQTWDVRLYLQFSMNHVVHLTKLHSLQVNTDPYFLEALTDKSTETVSSVARISQTPFPPPKKKEKTQILFQILFGTKIFSRLIVPKLRRVTSFIDTSFVLDLLSQIGRNVFFHLCNLGIGMILADGTEARCRLRLC